MFITRIRLENVRGFKCLDIDFGTTGASALITGDNGDGKTTVLRAIAIGLSDELGASGLLSELQGEFIRYGSDEAKIEIELKPYRGDRIKIDTTIQRREHFERVRQKYFIKSRHETKDWLFLDDTDFPFSEIFSAGYGAGLRIVGTERYQHYYLTDAVYTLFKNDAKLQEQEVAYRRLLDLAIAKARKNKADEKNAKVVAEKEITDKLQQLLNFLEPLPIFLKENGIFFGPKKSATELAAMGDGVQAIVTVALDLMSWWYLHLNDRKNLRSSAILDTHKYRGIVIIDEVEKHLHPSWQRGVVASFVEMFPNIQFIMSTHAPLCVSGSTDFGRDRIFLYRTFRTEEGPLSGTEYELPRGYQADEILTSQAFGLKTSVSPGVAELLNKIDNLMVLPKKSTAQEESLENLLKQLDAVSAQTGERQRDIVYQGRLQKLLEDEMPQNEEE